MVEEKEEGEGLLTRLRKKFPTVRRVSIEPEGLPMPKFQPCPQCGVKSKRKEKTEGGADYWCRRCKASFSVEGKDK